MKLHAVVLFSCVILLRFHLFLFIPYDSVPSCRSPAWDGYWVLDSRVRMRVRIRVSMRMRMRMRMRHKSQGDECTHRVCTLNDFFRLHAQTDDRVFIYVRHMWSRVRLITISSGHHATHTVLPFDHYWQWPRCITCVLCVAAIWALFAVVNMQH